jgi:hypothetical protein
MVFKVFVYGFKSEPQSQAAIPLTSLPLSSSSNYSRRLKIPQKRFCILSKLLFWKAEEHKDPNRALRLDV